jgi:hypothetical protein
VIGLSSYEWLWAASLKCSAHGKFYSTDEGSVNKLPARVAALFNFVLSERSAVTAEYASLPCHAAAHLRPCLGRLFSLSREWFDYAGVATFADVVMRRHHERYLQSTLMYTQRSLVYAAAAKTQVIPFSAYDDQAGYCGAKISDHLFKTLWARRVVRAASLDRRSLAILAGSGRGVHALVSAGHRWQRAET